jgi:amino acid adenylation domain-containing protein
MSSSYDLKKLEIAANQRIKEKNYWLKKLGEELPRSCFPYDYAPGEKPAEVRQESVEFVPDPVVYSNLIKIGGSSDIKIYMSLTAALVGLLHKYTRQDDNDIVIGTPVFKQKGTTGLINRAFVLKIRVHSRMSFRDLLHRLKQTLIETAENQNYPVEILSNQLNRPFTPGKQFPLFDTSIVYNNVHDEAHLRPLIHNMMFSFSRNSTGIAGKVVYNRSFYKITTITRIIRHYTKLLGDALSDLELKLCHLDILSQEERRQLIIELNQTSVDYPKGKLIHQLFKKQALQQEDNIALLGPSISMGEDFAFLSYRKLDRQSDQLAGVLRAKGVKPNSIVALITERSVEMMVGIMAILKAGGAYLPISPQYPRDRVNYLLKDSRSGFLLTHIHHDEYSNRPGIPGFKGEVITLVPPGIDKGKEPRDIKKTQNIPLENVNKPDDLVYIIYTSGSTGTPKGVMVEHRNLLAYVNAFYREFHVTSHDTVIQQASYTFDAFVEEVYPVLLRGGKIAIPSSHEILDIDLLLTFIKRNKINLISCSPLLLNELNLQHDKINTIHTFISGGDTLNRKHINNLLKIGNVYNTYGPTEATVCVTYYKCLAAREPLIPIGKPIANYKVFILSAVYKLQPIGAAGELCVSGHGVTRGYLNRPGITAEKFDHDLWDYQDDRDKRKNQRKKVPGKRIYSHMSYIYKTGDLSRWLHDGNIEFLGRIDHQVKIRGYRIELGEIENQLLLHPGVKEALVLSKEDEDGDKYLCAYVALNNAGALSQSSSVTSKLREQLSQSLPDYLIPSYFMYIEKFPLTPNGKIDRKALPKPGPGVDQGYIAPRDSLEKSLAGMWAETLGIEKHLIGIDSNFFQLGGHSLKATILAARIHKTFDIKLPLAEIFRVPRIRELSQYIKSLKKDKYISIEPAEKKEYYTLSSAQKRLYILQDMDLAGTAYNMPEVIPLGNHLHRERLERTFIELIQRHESLRTSFHMIADEPVQRIHDKVEFEIEYYDMKEVKVEEKERQTTDDRGQTTENRPGSHLSSEFIRPFDLSFPASPIYRHAPHYHRWHLSKYINKGIYVIV